MAKSSFSYVAALLSEGVRLYEPFWHRPSDDWVYLGPQTKFSDTKFMNMLRARLGCGSPATSAIRPHPDCAETETIVAARADSGAFHSDPGAISLAASDAAAFQNVWIGRFGRGMSNFVPIFGTEASISWLVQLPPGTYQVSAEYAAEESRPMELLIDGYPVTDEAMSEPTTGWFEADLQWATIAYVQLSSEAHVVAVRRSGAIPHLRQLKLTLL
jgi:hypothetical protein